MSSALASVPLLSTPAAAVPFTSINGLFNQINNTTGDCLTVRGISWEDFAKIEQERDASGRKFRLFHFADSKLLIITVPTFPHETLHRRLDDIIFSQALQMGLGDEWQCQGATTFRPTNGAGAGGEGDSSRRPRSQRPLPRDWPTLVIEAGMSQTLNGLRDKMRWWFRASNHAVKIVLLAKLEQHQQRVILEKWKEVPTNPSRPGPTTRAATALGPDCAQGITITRAVGITDTDPNRFNPASYVVISGALRLDFVDLFLRQPAQGEGDIIITVPQLQDYAAWVWRAVL